jgi:hypothetical protein
MHSSSMIKDVPSYKQVWNINSTCIRTYKYFQAPSKKQQRGTRYFVFEGWI